MIRSLHGKLSKQAAGAANPQANGLVNTSPSQTCDLWSDPTGPNLIILIQNFVDIHCNAMYSASMIPKELVAASAEPLVLSLLEHGESYGYAIIQEIRVRSEQQLQWTDGMLYPVLHRMEAKGLIKSRWGKSETGRKRKYYSLKRDGKKALQTHVAQWGLVNSVFTSLRKEQYV